MEARKQNHFKKHHPKREGNGSTPPHHPKKTKKKHNFEGGMRKVAPHNRSLEIGTTQRERNKAAPPTSQNKSHQQVSTFILNQISSILGTCGPRFRDAPASLHHHTPLHPTRSTHTAVLALVMARLVDTIFLVVCKEGHQSRWAGVAVAHTWAALEVACLGAAMGEKKQTATAMGVPRSPCAPAETAGHNV